MSLLTPFGKPQYLFRPRWALRRLLIGLGFAKFQKIVTLPWGSKLELELTDPVGIAIASQGLYEFMTTELIWRLTQKGERTFDVGANVGYFTSLLAHRVGRSGEVLAFEPHPATFIRLQRNIALQDRTAGLIVAHATALFETEGEGILELLPQRLDHTSYAFLTGTPSSTSISVKMSRGDTFIADRNVGLMKIDAQYQEAAVLKGFGRYLRSGAIRDIVFEEEVPYPADSHRVLLDAGYSIFWFEEHITGPRMIAPTEKPKNLRPYDIPCSFLATLDPHRAKRLMSPPGWQSF